MDKPFSFKRYGGYECSSKGDRRFSAFYAHMPDGRTLEAHYQCDVKGYEPGGTNWTLGKGKPALDTSKDLLGGYINLWRMWAKEHTEDIQDLYNKALTHHNGVLSDMFATTKCNQAYALSVVLNEFHSTKETK